tara:strand:- start:186 stop:500 length:315 start_codon:yes stop_codon:yes gene_type:complete
MAFFGENSCRFWVFSSSNGTIGDSFNVSSVNEVGNGNEDFTINFSTNFASTNYAASGNCNDTAAKGGQVFIDTKTTSSCRANVRDTGGGNNTNTDFCAFGWGDQ